MNDSLIVYIGKDVAHRIITKLPFQNMKSHRIPL